MNQSPTPLQIHPEQPGVYGGPKADGSDMAHFICWLELQAGLHTPPDAQKPAFLPIPADAWENAPLAPENTVHAVILILVGIVALLVGIGIGIACGGGWGI